MYLILQRESSAAKIFDVPVPIGSEVRYYWSKSDKELLFLYFKPTCPACIEIKPVMNKIAEQYRNKINIIGLCTNKYYKELSNSKDFNFDFMELDVVIHDALHLAFTPQVGRIDNYNVSFAFQFWHWISFESPSGWGKNFSFYR